MLEYETKYKSKYLKKKFMPMKVTFLTSDTQIFVTLSSPIVLVKNKWQSTSTLSRLATGIKMTAYWHLILAIEYHFILEIIEHIYDVYY